MLNAATNNVRDEIPIVLGLIGEVSQLYDESFKSSVRRF